MFGELTHHAYLIVGRPVLIVPELQKQFAGAEIIHRIFPQFGIDDSRELREFQTRKVGEKEERVFILELGSITIEAQQALLKTLEEPATRTKFFLISPSVQIFLPTLLSRLQIITLDSRALLDPSAAAEAKDFLAATPEKRLAMIQKIIEENETAATGRARASAFVLALELQFVGKNNVLALENLEQARSYLGDRAASVRLILEHLAVVL